MRADIHQGRRVLRISGQDARDFLQGMVTNDVAKLDHGAVYAALLSPQGKYLADFLMIPEGADVLLDTAEGLAGGLVQRLSMYKLRADVTVAPTDLQVLRGLGDPPPEGFADPRASELGWRIYTADPPPLDPTGTDWEALRVDHLVPEGGVELVPNDSYILECGFERLNGVDFRKGCYVGQEVTARMHHKTQLKKGLAQVVIDGAAPVGTEITADGKAAGQVFSQSGGKAIAWLRFDRATGDMTAGDARLRLVP